MRRMFMYKNYEDIGVLWSQPILTENGTLGGDTFAVYSEVLQYSLSISCPYFCFDGATGPSVNNFHSHSGVTSGYIIMYNPNPLCFKNMKITNQSSSLGNRSTKTGNIYGSNTNGDWNLLTTINRSSYSDYEWNIDLSSNSNYYKYYKYETLTTFSSYWTINEITITAYTKN